MKNSKPELCVYADICREAENGYSKCVDCINAKRRTYFQEFTLYELEENLLEEINLLNEVSDTVEELEKED